MSEYRHPELGPVELVRSSRARRLSIRVRATGEVRLSLPRGVSEAEALRFLDEKRQWVETVRERLARRNPPQTVGMPFATRAHALQLLPDDCPGLSFRIADGRIVVRYPASMRYDEPDVQRLIRQAVEEAWRIEAKAYLPGRVGELCRALGFRCGKVTVRNSRSRWGSCSVSDDISLSLHLMKLPDRLIDYVIVHELCHTVHRNHGPRFHALLNRMTGGEHPRLRAELRKYSTRW